MGTAARKLAACMRCGNLPDPPQPPFVMLNANDVIKILNDNGIATSTFTGPDWNYVALSESEYMRFVGGTQIDQIAYNHEKKGTTDCDDFAIMLMGRSREWFSEVDLPDGIQGGLAFGYVSGDLRKPDKPNDARHHAINIAITDDRRVIYIEPQKSEIVTHAGNSVIRRVFI
jgi:hypothetical protein